MIILKMIEMDTQVSYFKIYFISYEIWKKKFKVNMKYINI